MEQKLIEIVNVFQCCIFTPRALTTVLPAFLLAGAIAAFVPRAAVLHYLGPRARKTSAYLVSALSGVLLSLCSCNVVPLFVSIYRQGAGIGPAFTFLYAGPAINVVSLIFVFQVIGWRLGVWRALAVPALATVIGVLAARMYRREEEARNEALVADAASAQTDGGMTHIDRRELAQALTITTLLLLFVIVGSIHIPAPFQAVAMIVILAVAISVAYRTGSADKLQEWMAETWSLLKLVIPVLIPALLLIGAAAAYVDVKWVYRLVGHNRAPSIIAASIFGSLMYFPILSEVVFTKAFLKLGMATGPALAVLLTGAGLSLPGAVILARVIGWRKVAVYMFMVMAGTALISVLFAWQVGQYMCPCTMEGTP